MAFHPDMWIEAATYLEQASKQLAEKGVCSISDVCLVSWLKYSVLAFVFLCSFSSAHKIAESR
jgi:hypothetical protein